MNAGPLRVRAGEGDGGRGGRMRMTEGGGVRVREGEGDRVLGCEGGALLSR